MSAYKRNLTKFNWELRHFFVRIILQHLHVTVDAFDMGGKIYTAPFFIGSQLPSSVTIFYMDDQWFFLLLPRLGGIEGEKGVGKREISLADKRVRFIASLILFIDTRIALRLRSQRLRRRNSVAKLGRVKTPPFPPPMLFTRAILSRSYISSARVDNTHISQLTLVRYLVTELPVITANSSQSW